jgi:FHA domain
MDSQQQITHSHTGNRARIALIDLSELAGTERRTMDVLAWPITLGRALDNHIVIDDPFVSAHHAVLDTDADGRLQITVLDSINGVEFVASNAAADHHLAAGQSRALPLSDVRLQLGNTRLRLRMPQELLAPEQALPRAQRPIGTEVPVMSNRKRGRAWLWLAGLALMALEAASHWIGLDPGADFAAWMPLLLGVPAAIVMWCGVWAFLSKLFNQHFDFSGHLKLALPWMLAMALAQALWPQISAALASPFLWRLTPVWMVVLAAFMVRAHLSHVLPYKRQAVAVGVAAMAVTAVGISAAGNHRAHDSLSSAPYMSTLPLPALRLGSIGGEQKLVQGLAPLAAQLAIRVKKSRDEDEDDTAD